MLHRAQSAPGCRGEAVSRVVHFALSLVAVGLLVGADCGGGPTPTITILSPAHGAFSTAPNVTISGTVSSPNTGLQVQVNGSLASFNPADGTWSITLPLNAATIINPFMATVNRTSDGKILSRQRIVVHASSSVADGSFSSQGVALRINDSGLDQLEPIIESQIDLDLATLLPVNTVIINNECFLDSFLGCLMRVTVRVANPPPSISGFNFDADSQTNLVFGDIDVFNIQVQLQISGGISCGLRVNASQASITGNYGLQPMAGDPSSVDVNLIGAPGVVLSGFSHTFTSGVCDWFLIGDIIQAAIGDIQPVVVNGLAEFLDDDDGGGPGDSPLADAFEVALGDISITGPISEALGVHLEAPLFDVLENTTGITLGSNVRVTSSVGSGPGQCQPPAGTPNLAASYHVAEPFPSFGGTTPVSGLPYHLGIAISTSAFNQLLKSQIECGLLQIELNEIDLGFGPVPLTAGVLALLIPELTSYPAETPMRVRLTPSLGPFLTGSPGPGGELGEIRVGQYRIDLFVDSPSTVRVLGGALDFRAGLNMSFDNGTGQLVVGIGSVAPADITVAVLDNAINTNETSLQLSLPFLIASVLPELGEGLGAFPIPGFFGLSLNAVEVSRSSSFYSLFTNLAPAP
jgi:hypothetical protein